MDKNKKTGGVDGDDPMDATIEIEPLNPEEYALQIAARSRDDDGDSTGAQEQVVLGEVDPTLHPLREKLVSVQSQVALQSETILLLEGDLKSSSNVIRHLESELTEKTTTLELQTSELENRQQRIDGLSGRNEGLEAGVSSLKTDLAVATETAGHAKARLEQKVGDIEILRGKHTAELERGKALEQKIAAQEAAQGVQESIIADLNKDLKVRQDDMNGLRDQLTTRNNHASALEERLTQRASAISELEANIEAHGAAMSKLQQEAMDLTQTIKGLEMDLAKRDDTVTELEKALADWKDRYTHVESTIAQRDTQIAHMESELSEYHKKITDRDSVNAGLSEQQDDLVKEVAKYKKRVEEVEAAMMERKSTISALASERKADVRQLESLKSELTAKSDTIESRTSAIEAQHQTIKVLDQKNIEFQRQSDSMYETLQRREARISELENVLATKDSALSTIQLGILKLSEYGARPVVKQRKSEQPNISIVFQKPPKDAHATRFLVNLDGEGRTRYPIYKSPLTVGRGRANDIQINNDFISGYHAEFIETDDGITLKDLGSTNASRVNAKRIKSHNMHDGDVVTFGELRFEFIDEAQRPETVKTPVARIK